MIDNTDINKILSLAGVFQAAALVKHLAKTGKIQEPYFTANIESLFKIDAIDVPDVYGGKENVALGLQELIRLFSNNKLPKDTEIARYVFSLLHLERKLSKNQEMQTHVQTGIKRAKIQATHFNSTHENVLANLAGIYTDTLSTYKFRIHVSGEQLYLNQTFILHKIRALLLAGIRSALLWRQMGGKRWQLLISRHSMIEAAQYCLKAKAFEKID
jgi:high frequency lysogenization protein